MSMPFTPLLQKQPFQPAKTSAYYRFTFVAFCWLAALLTSPNAWSTVRYVRPTAFGLGSGTSWANASADLQAILNASAAGDTVWVAAGTYLPTQDPLGNGSPSDLRDRTFFLPEGVLLYGGFAGNETALSERDWVTNVTVLSGELGSPGDASDNAYHVVFPAYTSTSAEGPTIDGFTISGGNASSDTYFSLGGSFNNISRANGGGICARRGAGTVLRNLKVQQCAALNYGGGIYTTDMANLILSKDSVISNSAGYGGGAYLEYSGNHIVDSCVVISNTCGAGSGGGFYINDDGTLSNSTIADNTSGGYGGGLYLNVSMSYTLRNNTIDSNYCNYDGGGAYLDGGNFSAWSLISNAVFSNTAGTGGGFYVNDGVSTLINNSFFNNTAAGYGGILLLSSDPHVLRNNIFWRNKTYSALNNTTDSTSSGADIGLSLFGTYTITNNLLQLANTAYSLGSGASGNLYATDPLFADAAQPLGPDGLARTSDDGLALSPCSPAVNAGATPSPTIPNDILGNGRVGAYDPGAYEFQGAAEAITGDNVLCLHGTSQLVNSTTGGIWSSSDATVATVSPDGLVTTVGPGSAIISYTISYSAGCTSGSTLSITVTEVITTTTQAGAQLTATGNQPGATYQWVRCTAGYPAIPSATGTTYNATANGQYAVIVSYNDCSDTSDCHTVTGLGVSLPSGESVMQAIPLPDGQLMIRTGAATPGRLQVFSIDGKLLRDVKTQSGETRIDLADVPKGIYVLYYTHAGRKAVIKVAL